MSLAGALLVSLRVEATMDLMEKMVSQVNTHRLKAECFGESNKQKYDKAVGSKVERSGEDLADNDYYRGSHREMHAVGSCLQPGPHHLRHSQPAQGPLQITPVLQPRQPRVSLEIQEGHRQIQEGNRTRQRGRGRLRGVPGRCGRIQGRHGSQDGQPQLCPGRDEDAHSGSEGERFERHFDPPCNVPVSRSISRSTSKTPLRLRDSTLTPLPWPPTQSGGSGW